MDPVKLTDAEKRAEEDARDRICVHVDRGVVQAIRVMEESLNMRHVRAGVIAVRLAKHLGLAIKTITDLRDQNPHIQSNVDLIHETINDALREMLERK